MRNPGCTRWLTRLAWALVFIDLLCIFLLPADQSFDNIALLFVCTVWIIFSPILASTWLIIRYRSFFRTWPGWITPIVTLIFSMMVSQGVISIHQPNLDFFFTVLSVVSGWAIGIATIILLWYRDVGLGLIGWAAVLIVWIMMFAWRFQGNLMEGLILAIERPNDKPHPLWWFGPLTCVIQCIVPLGIIGFLEHTVRLIVREWHTRESSEQ
jgi:hypothetical protein